MVGVPHSTGCRTCVRRKVKCDEARPKCQRCTKRAIECLGYHRPLEFRIQRQGQPRHGREIPGHPRSVASEQGNKAVLAPRPTIDEAVAPSLAYEALTIQTKASFYRWLISHFPRIHSSFSFRVDIGWMEFICNRPVHCSPTLMWAIRALITFQMGTIQESEQNINCARHMYGRGIYHLRSQLQSPSALSDESLAACVLLGGYEVLDGNCANSWISHTRGIRHIMCARGPLAHKSGMGRTLMICIRPFLLAEAFALGEPCFLGFSEWTSITEPIPSDNRQRGTASQLSLIMDHAFNEIAKCPGYYARTQSILCAPTDSNASSLACLLSEISHSRTQLLSLRDLLNITHTGPRSDISPTYMESMTRLTLVGVNTALALLGQLSILLQSDTERRLGQQQASFLLGHRSVELPVSWHIAAEKYSACSPEGLPEINDDLTTMSSTMKPIGDRFDTFSLTMGIESVLKRKTSPG